MEVFLSIVGCGAGGCELRFRRLKPLTWIFGKECWHDAYGYMCFGGGGIHFRGGGGAAAVAKRSVLVCKNVLFCAKMAVYTVRITGWALKRKS
jgi:hypothetical protein